MIERTITLQKAMQQIEDELDKKIGKCPRCADVTLLLKHAYKAKHKINADVCPKGHGLWLDGGEIEKLRNRGMVNLHDQLEFYLDFLRYAFSKDGFGDFKRKILGKSQKAGSDQ